MLCWKGVVSMTNWFGIPEKFCWFGLLGGRRMGGVVVGNV